VYSQTMGAVRSYLPVLYFAAPFWVLIAIGGVCAAYHVR
jgi:hypothetical protein